MAKFSVTYDIVTQESAEYGDVDEQGFICESVSLREAIELVQETRTNEVDGVMSIDADECPARSPQWITITNGMEYRTGAQERRSLHMPNNLTTSTRLRIARLLGVRF